MARKVRIEYENAYYHVINRGNYRSWIFETEGARKSFLECLTLTAEAKGWRVHAWCLMSNHYHLLIQTPGANLVEGMKWLQSTFAGAKCLASGAASNGDVELGEQSCQPLP